MEPPKPLGTIAQSPEDVSRIATALSGAVAVPGFDIESELGRGGMGVVYKAKQAGLNRTVALKVVLAGPFADPSTRARFLLEAEAVAAVDHPHVVKVFAFGEHAGFPYLVMEYLGGGTLADSLKANGPLPARAAAEMVRKLTDAVSHVHDRGVIHRDIKPLNVLLTPAGEPRLTDFGLAKVGRAESNLSVTGQVLGTPAYMSPEQAAGKVRELGPPTDIYALGALLYDLLVGRPPFVGDSLAVTLVQVLTAEPARLRTLKPDIPAELEAICLKCLEKDRAKRYATAGELIADLDRYLAGEAVLAEPPKPAPPAKRPRRKWAIALAAVVAFFAACVVVKALLMSRSGTPHVEQPPPEVKPTESEDRSQVLFKRGNLAGWAGWVVQTGAAFQIVVFRDGEQINPDKAGALRGEGEAVRTFDPPLPNSFRVNLGLDFSDTERVDVVIAADPTGERQLLIVIDNADKAHPKITFGKRAGDGAFVPNKELGWRPLPSAAALRAAGKSPYIELKYTRAGMRIAVPFAGALLAAEDLDGLQTTELRVHAIGGPVFIDAAYLEDLTVMKK